MHTRTHVHVHTHPPTHTHIHTHTHTQILNELIDLCKGENTAHKQRLLRNMKAHEVVLELLQVPYKVSESISEKAPMCCYVIWFFNFFCWLCERFFLEIILIMHVHVCIHTHSLKISICERSWEQLMYSSSTSVDKTQPTRASSTTTLSSFSRVETMYALISHKFYSLYTSTPPYTQIQGGWNWDSNRDLPRQCPSL